MLDPQYAPEVYLEGAITRRSPLSREHHGPRAVLNALERLAGGYGSECSRVLENLGIAESQLRDYKARLGAPFPHDAYLAELTGLRDQLKAGLSGVPPEQGADAPPTVAELAERIKALKAAHTIEAAPQRTGKRRSSAEEPVTARIRRRIEAETRCGFGNGSRSCHCTVRDNRAGQIRSPGRARKPPAAWNSLLRCQRGPTLVRPSREFIARTHCKGALRLARPPHDTRIMKVLRNATKHALVIANVGISEVPMSHSVQLSDQLIEAARHHATVSQRSVPKQIEYWARIGKIADENPDLPYALIKEILHSKREADAGNLTEYQFG